MTIATPVAFGIAMTMTMTMTRTRLMLLVLLLQSPFLSFPIQLLNLLLIHTRTTTGIITELDRRMDEQLVTLQRPPYFRQTCANHGLERRKL